MLQSFLVTSEENSTDVSSSGELIRQQTSKPTPKRAWWLLIGELLFGYSLIGLGAENWLPASLVLGGLLILGGLTFVFCLVRLSIAHDRSIFMLGYFSALLTALGLSGIVVLIPDSPMRSEGAIDIVRLVVFVLLIGCMFTVTWLKGKN